MLKKKDLIIMSYLRQNSRQRLTSMSRKTQMPVSTIYDRIKSYEGGLIKKHTCLLDFSKLGFSTRATIMLKVNRESRDTVGEFLSHHQSINTVYKVNNGFDFMLEALFKQIKDLEDFMEMIESKFKIDDSKTYFIIDEIKRESFLSNPDTAELLSIDK